eukprot:CAMPEP_0201281574 /NCGR_PEP_ID=MMETSP1317-20130820/3381_1 /ASSEMBLY_ACC=CAM_ASM_000770 /TAXON_ID=187299 /ORGANISM="Undescribed Undescribed, Strain Undescribed" /LENGTH=108 /DNA_ID=CAMNT_0047591781 /DNA_START=772 /DNA_END=1098 /DNA_ORIENTATION=-
MHGVGYQMAKLITESFEFPPFYIVEEQVHPDPEFTTVVFPNPEEGEGALKLAMETAEKNGARLILANDPDADRMAVAEKLSSGWEIYSGDQIGIVLAYWLLTHYTGTD